MNDKQKKILEAIKESDHPMTEIVSRFGDESMKDVQELLKGKLLEIVHGDGYAAFETLKITKLGIMYTYDDYCDVCECLPCDCNWGN